MFYEYRQNNSGGEFIEDDKLCHIVVIESDSEKEADEIAEDMGIYFDGVERDIDCPCCGDRWYSSYLIETDKDIVQYYEDRSKDNLKWTSPEVRIFYKDGQIKEIF